LTLGGLQIAWFGKKAENVLVIQEKEIECHSQRRIKGEQRSLLLCFRFWFRLSTLIIWSSP
jgi:hypothetical protein